MTSSYLVEYIYWYQEGINEHWIILKDPFTGEFARKKIDLKETLALQQICQDLTTEENYFCTYQLAETCDGFIYFIPEGSYEDRNLKIYFKELFEPPSYQVRIRKAITPGYNIITDNYGTRELIKEELAEQLIKILENQAYKVIETESYKIYRDIETPDDTFEDIIVEIEAYGKNDLKINKDFSTD
ncbi:3646_t:CDS:1, partial [Acaulospora colombiana]